MKPIFVWRHVAAVVALLLRELPALRTRLGARD